MPVSTIHHRRHVRARLGRADLAQHVIAAEAQHHEVRLARQIVEREGEALQPRRTRITRYARIDDRGVDACLPQPRLDRVGQILPALQPIARIEAVAQSEDQPLGARRPRHVGRRCCGRRDVRSRIFAGKRRLPLVAARQHDDLRQHRECR
jgi:hypothetical protein